MCSASGRINILVVDDNIAQAEVLQELIEEQPIYKCHISTSCQEAENLFHPNKFAIAFVDLNLDGSINNGIRLIQTLRKLDNTVFIVVISAYPDAIYNKVLIECVDDFIKKPIDENFFSSKLFLWSTKYERRNRENQKIKEQYKMFESRLVDYEDRLNKIKKLDLEICQIAERLEASIPGEDNWFARNC